MGRETTNKKLANPHHFAPPQYLKTILKPCPFCGKDEGEKTHNDDADSIIRCMNCGAIGPPCGYLSDAIEAWNERKKDA